MVAAIAENPGKEVRKRLWRDPLKRVLFGKVVCLHVAGRPLDAQEASTEPILDTGTQAQPRESHSGGGRGGSTLHLYQGSQEIFKKLLSFVVDDSLSTC